MAHEEELQPIELTLKNYRGFSDENPLRVQLAPGFTALVGPNNSGKSSVLRFFYELRGLWKLLSSIAGIDHLLIGRPGGIDLTPSGIDDSEEIFHDGNSRDLSIRVEFTHAADNHIRRLDLKLARADLCVTGELFIGSDMQKVGAIGIGRGGPYALTNSGEHQVDLLPFFSTFRVLQDSLYIGPFRNLLSGVTGSHFDLEIGTSFIATWGNWKTGSSRSQNKAIQQVTEEIARILGYNRLEVNSANNRTNLQVTIDGKPYWLQEIGAGLAQFLVVFGNAVFRRPSLLLVDEPESNLHPSLQVDFLTSLASYATHGVIFATHSLGLARATAERIYSFQKHNGAIHVRNFEQTANYAEFVGELSFSAFKELGHDLILLVEGVTEVRAVQQLLRLLGVEHRVVILPLGGAQMIRADVEPELSELLRVTKRVAVLIDSERDSPQAELSADRAAFTQSCRKLGFYVHVTQLRAFENYLPEDAIQRVKGPKYRALKAYERLIDAPNAWGKHENWRIAREMSRDDLLATDVGQFLKSIFPPTDSS